MYTYLLGMLVLQNKPRHLQATKSGLHVRSATETILLFHPKHIISIAIEF